MIRKFKAQIVATASVRALATLVFECDRAGWPEEWAPLRESARDALLSLRGETDALLALIAKVDAGRGVLTVFADERDEALSAAGIITAATDFDLSTLLEDDHHGPDALRAFVQLLDLVARSSVYALALRMGTREAVYEDVLDELRSQAHERGVLLDVPPPPSDFTSEPPRKRGSGSDRIDPSEVFGDGRPSVASSDDLDDDERAFLDEAGIDWPVRRRALEEAWRQVAFAVHPDRRPDDPLASLRFVRLKTGYERLRERSV
ncbi:MAG: hypothetical protein U0269_26225 [Polyangiales bacterium]